MNPLDLINSLLPSLKDKEREELLRQLLNGLPPPCMKTGHKFKAIEHHPEWKYLGIRFVKARTVLFCEKCAEVRTIAGQ
jgi:hypothetical protein